MNTKLFPTKTNYEKYLNKLSPPPDSDKWIIGGKKRSDLAFKQKYGLALKKHDPIAFEVGYNEWKLNL